MHSLIIVASRKLCSSESVTCSISYRPTSLAWEVRKTSPGKRFPAPPQDRHHPPAQRTHQTTEKQSATSMDSSQKQAVISWADRVRGIKPSEIKAQPKCIETVAVPDEREIDEVCDVAVVMGMDDVGVSGECDDKQSDGWETVSRSRPGRGARRRLGTEDQFRVEKSRDTVKEWKEDCKQTEVTTKLTLSAESSDVRTNDVASEHVTKVLTKSGKDDVRIEGSDVMREPDDITSQVPSDKADVLNDVIIQSDDVTIQDQSSHVSDSSDSNVVVTVECFALSSDEDEELLAVPLSDDERLPSVCVEMEGEQAVSLSDVGDESEISVSGKSEVMQEV